MKNIEINLVKFIRIPLSVIFLVSSLSKIFTIEEYFETIYEFRILPELLIFFCGYLIILAEYILGIFLLFNKTAKIAASGLIVLILFFLTAIVINLIRGNIVECGCFGNYLEEKIGWSILLRDFIILGLLYIINKNSPNPFCNFNKSTNKVI